VSIKKFHDLPGAAAKRDAGWKPDSSVRFGHILAERWDELSEPRLRALPGARFRHSHAGACARAVGYAALDVEPSNPMDLAGTWVTQQGVLIHDAWQEELQRRYGPASASVEVVVGSDDRAGHVDAVITSSDKVIAVEGKSVGGYAYQLAVGAKGRAEGPRFQAVCQAALNGYEVDADEVVIVYWARDAISVQQARRKNIGPLGRFVAEWTLPRERYEPIAKLEIERVEQLLLQVDGGQYPARHIPDPELPANHLIVDPRQGAWVELSDDGQAIDAGATWQCAYCPWLDMCALTEPGPIPIPQTLEEGT
jgi:hypothetical protein